MLTVEDYGAIRRAHRDGVSIREMPDAAPLAACKGSGGVAGVGAAEVIPAQGDLGSEVGPVKAVIDEILAADEQAPPKQRHEATHSSVACGGAMGTVAATIKCGITWRETRPAGIVRRFLPLVALPGSAGLGLTRSYLGGPSRTAGASAGAAGNVGLSYASSPWPCRRAAEAVLEGLVQALEFFGCVPLGTVGGTTRPR